MALVRSTTSGSRTGTFHRTGSLLAGLAIGAAGGAGAAPALAKTEARGRVTFRLDRPGLWLCRTPLIRPVAGRHGEWESVFTTVTVHVEP